MGEELRCRAGVRRWPCALVGGDGSGRRIASWLDRSVIGVHGAGGGENRSSHLGGHHILSMIPSREPDARAAESGVIGRL
jgi:hypothetical protein